MCGLEVGGLQQRIAGFAEQAKGVGIAEVWSQQRGGPEMIEVLRPAERLEELAKSVGHPVIALSQRLQHAACPCCAARARYSRHPADCSGHGIGEQVGAKERAHVGDHPVIAGLDEEIVPKTVEVVTEVGGLASDRREGAPAGQVALDIEAR